MMKHIPFVCGVILTMQMLAAPVNWVQFGSSLSHDENGGECVFWWTNEKLTPYPYLSLVYTVVSGGVHVEVASTIMEFTGAWYKDEPGKVIGPSTAFTQEAYLSYTALFFEDLTYRPQRYDILIPTGDSAYLAVVAERDEWNGTDYHTGDYYYGWLILENIDNVLYAPYSRFDLDGNALYIGGGIASSSGIPEPSSGMLLSIGLVALALSRRVNTNGAATSNLP